MADTFARQRQLIGSPAEWQANNLIIGSGEIAIERDGATDKLKIGDGTRTFSALPYITSQVTIDFASLAELRAGTVSNKAIAPDVLAANSATTGGGANAGKLVVLGTGGKLDPSLINITGGMNLKGNADVTATAPAAVSGDYYFAQPGGVADASFAGIAGDTINAGDVIIYDGANWHANAALADLGNYLPLTGGTLTGNLNVTGDVTITGKTIHYGDFFVRDGHLGIYPNATTLASIALYQPAAVARWDFDVTGKMRLVTTNTVGAASEVHIDAIRGGGVDLYYNNQKIVEVLQWGEQVTGQVRVDNVAAGQDSILSLMSPQHINVVSGTVQGAFSIYRTGLSGGNNENILIDQPAGGTQLFFNNALAIETQVDGVNVYEEIFHKTHKPAGTEFFTESTQSSTGRTWYWHCDNGSGYDLLTFGFVNIPTQKDLMVFSEDSVILFGGGNQQLATRTGGGDLKGTWKGTVTSDGALKKNHKPVNGAERLNKLTPTKWEWENDGEDYSDQFPQGYTAQDWAHAYPEDVTTDENGNMVIQHNFTSLKYHADLLAYTHELKSQIDDLETRLHTLETEH